MFFEKLHFLYIHYKSRFITKTDKNQELIITAVDKSGNISVMKKKLPVDLVADLPVVVLDYPVYDATNKEDKGPMVEDELFIRGSVEDDDGVSTLYWSVDNGEEHSLKTEGVFYVDIFEEIKKSSENSKDFLLFHYYKITWNF